MTVAPLSDIEFGKFQRFIYDAAGIALSTAKKPLVSGRLAKRLYHFHITQFGDYFDLIASGRLPDETQLAIDLLTTNETYFFREPRHFELLHKLVAEARPGRPFRTWSAACASGEETYSIAMVLADRLAGQPWELLGSDISLRMLARARAGHYPLVRTSHIPPDYLRRFCLRGIGKEDGTLLVERTLREAVQFEQHNLVAPAQPMGNRFDVIFLRNVLIYFDRATKQRVVAHVVEQLQPGGYLLIGHSESLHDIATGLRSLGPSVYRKE